MVPARRKAVHDAMVRLRDGDRSAFDTLLAELWPVVLSFAQRGVGAGVDAEDIAQEVFFKICSRIADFDPTRDGLSWAFGIAHYEILSHRRRQRRRRETHDPTAISAEPATAPSQEEALLEREVRLAFDAVVSTLSESDRLALGVDSGMAPDTAWGPTLRKRRQRALDRLRIIWRGLYGES